MYSSPACDACVVQVDGSSTGLDNGYRIRQGKIQFGQVKMTCRQTIYAESEKQSVWEILLIS